MITEVSQLNSWAFTWKQIKVIIFSVLFGNILIKILLTKLGRSEWEPSWSHALVQTSCVRSVLVNLIPQRSHTASQWFNIDWLDVLDFWGYPNDVQVSWPSCLRQLLTALQSFKIFLISPLLMRVLPLAILQLWSSERGNFWFRLVRKI